MYGEWTALAIGFTVGVTSREILSGWLDMLHHLVAGLRSSLPPSEPVAAPPAPERVLNQIKKSLGEEMLAALHAQLNQVIALSFVAGQKGRR